MNNLVATEWSTVEDKQKFINHFKRFVKSDYKYTLFYKWFYKRLSMCFGFIAHYNKDGFYHEYFTRIQDIQRFESIIKRGHSYMGGPIGDPRFTWVDAETQLMNWIKEHRS